jgi:hypothetical protein
MGAGNFIAEKLLIYLPISHPDNRHKDPGN